MDTSDRTNSNEENRSEGRLLRGETRNIISVVAYLIGVHKRHFDAEHEPPLAEVYGELENTECAKIIRELCRLRTAVERNFAAVNQIMQTEFRSICTMPELVPTDAIDYLAERGINIVRSGNRQPVDYIIGINRVIADRINNCSILFPIWVDFRYIRELFIMPDGFCVKGTKNAASVYYANRHKYPYQMYINWIPDDCGNILYNDKKFLQILYRMHGAEFEDISRVSDVGESIKDNIRSFIAKSGQTVLVVDCENSDPYKLIAAVKGIGDEHIARIGKILLYNDVHASSAWELFEGYCTNVHVEHIMTERVKESKSLVDIKLSCGVAREFYKNGVDSFIVASSDSDYWGLIDSIRDARFLVMAERDKCGSSIRAALGGRDIYFCYIDDFCTGNYNEIKIAALLRQTRRYIESHISLNVRVMLDEVYKNTRVHMTEAECTQFYNKYIRPMKLVIGENGDVSVEIRGK